MKLHKTPQSYLETVKEVEEAIESLKKRGLIVERSGDFSLTKKGLKCARSAKKSGTFRNLLD